jgi:MFS family permease
MNSSLRQSAYANTVRFLRRRRSNGGPIPYRFCGQQQPFSTVNSHCGGTFRYRQFVLVPLVSRHRSWYRISGVHTEPTSVDSPSPSSPPISPQAVQNSKTLPSKPIPLSLLYRYLHLEHFTRDELELIFDRIVRNDTLLHSENLKAYLWTRIGELEVESDLSITKKEKKEKKGADTLNTSIGNPVSQASLNPAAPTVSAEAPPTNDAFCWSQSTSQNKEYDPDRHLYISNEAQRILQVLAPATSTTNASDISISKTQFVDRITELATQIDQKRTAPVFLSMLLVGASVGVITPAMPFVVQALQLTAAQYGGVVAAFGLAKMIGNIPAAIAVERHGRKPYMTYSLAVIALGVGGIGLASSFETLYLCRLLTGFGVAALSTAGTLMITDVSTPLNRASTYAPAMSAFAAGTAFGPALGGVMVDYLGLHATFYVVGISYLGVAMVNNAILSETKSRPIEFPWQQQDAKRRKSARSSAHLRERSETEAETFRDAIQGAIGQWIPLVQDPLIRSVLILNGVFWIALAGGQMTLLPLILTNDLHFTATQVGQVYMGMSMIQIFGNPIFGKVIDRVGKAPVMIGATTCIGTAMYSLPYACNIDPTVIPVHSMETLWPLAATLGLWSVGSSMLSTAPLAYVSDRVDDHKRAQAIALLRTCGDVGFLVGATGTGALADYTNSLDLALQSNAGLLLSATLWFAFRQAFLSRQKPVVDVMSTAPADTTTSAKG